MVQRNAIAMAVSQVCCVVAPCATTPMAHPVQLNANTKTCALLPLAFEAVCGT